LITKSPHTGSKTQLLGCPEQVQPFSIRQLTSHPSPVNNPESSHSSPTSNRPSPHL